MGFNYMKNTIILLSIFFLFVACNEEASFKERDALLEKAFSDISSSDENTVIKGIKTIEKYPTYLGLRNLISLWESEISEEIEKELLDALNEFEEFILDDSLVLEIFNRNFDKEATIQKKMKLKRLIDNTDSKIKTELIAKIDKEI